MITKVEINGFKSLTNFKMRLKPGLNILVGPNGSGKTNIILFFEFLSNLIHSQLSNSVSYLGGAGSIFKKIGNEEYQDFIEAKIYGSSKTDSKEFIIYEYSFQIRISFEKDNLYFSSQNIKLKKVAKFWDNPEARLYPNDWDLDISFKSDGSSTYEIDLAKIDRKKIKPRFLPPKISEKQFETLIKHYLHSYNLSFYSMLHSLFRITEYARFIRTDLKGGETFNIIPSKVKELEDSASTPEIKKDGSGLATTLYAMKKSKSKVTRERQAFLFNIDEQVEKVLNPNTLERIISFLRLANSTISDLNVDNDPFNNKVVVRITITSGEYQAILPLSSMSDGTIKWLTLITAILTSKTIFSIEEPENFLHPWMQAEIINIMREHLTDKGTSSFVLMTTHSESLLNYAKPEEVIIVDLNGGGTKARRLTNAKEVRDEISNSGFGLGHFYFSNALS